MGITVTRVLVAFLLASPRRLFPAVQVSCQTAQGSEQVDNLEGKEEEGGRWNGGVNVLSGPRDHRTGGNDPRRRKRLSDGSQVFLLEEYKGKDPQFLGRFHSDFDEGGRTIIYTLEGEGAGVVFAMQGYTGDVYALRSLDRENKAQYTLLVRPLEHHPNKAPVPASELIVTVQDINDNKPGFSSDVFIARVPEMSQVGTFVFQTTAYDADDPLAGGNAQVKYSLVIGLPYFSVSPETGEIRTAWDGMDRETRDHYQVVLQAQDMWGERGGLTGTTTIDVIITDINDNPPRFTSDTFELEVRESTRVFSTIGRVVATDADVGENAMITYTIRPSDSAEFFAITTDPATQDGIIKVVKPLDYEVQSGHTLDVEAANTVPLQGLVPSKMKASVRVLVLDSKEPPEFDRHQYELRVAEDVPVGTLVGTVSATDPDGPKIPVRYVIDRRSDLGLKFDVNAITGEIRTRQRLDREEEASFILLLQASEIEDSSQVGQASVVVHIVDVNDNAPEIVPPTDLPICENAHQGEVLHVLHAIDRDEPSNGPTFHFSLFGGAMSPNFILRDNLNDTASIISKREHFNRTESHFVLRIRVTDRGVPPQAKINFLTLSVCKCNSVGLPVACAAEALHGAANHSTEGLVAVAVCFFSLLVIIVLFLALRRKQNEPILLDEGLAFDIINDNTEGCENDTEAFDISVLQWAAEGMAITSGFHDSPKKCPPCVVLQESNDSLDVTSFINAHVKEANSCPGLPPFDSILVYNYEGVCSEAGSLSSLNSGFCDLDLNDTNLQESSSHVRANVQNI